MQTHILIFCLSADPSAGRFDTSMLSDQAMLELLAQGFDEESQERFQEGGEFLEFSKWEIVDFDEYNVFYLDVTPEEDLFGDDMPMRGVFEAKFVPRKVGVLSIRRCDFGGILDFASLPEMMTMLEINSTPFEGSIEAEALPPELKRVEVHTTKHSGSINFSKLPKNIEYCSFSGCAFTGSVNLAALPTNLRGLNISDNDFSGTADLCHLPAELSSLNLSCNAFRGSVCLDKLPSSMLSLDLGDNGLTGELSDGILQNLPGTMLRFAIHNNDFSGTIDLQECRKNLDVCVHRMLPEHRKAKAMHNKRLEVRKRAEDEYNEY